MTNIHSFIHSFIHHVEAVVEARALGRPGHVGSFHCRPSVPIGHRSAARRVGDEIVRACGALGALMGHVNVFAAYYLDAVYQKLGPALRQTVSDVGHFTWTPLAALGEYCTQLRDVVLASDAYAYVVHPRTLYLMGALVLTGCLVAAVRHYFYRRSHALKTQ